MACDRYRLLVPMLADRALGPVRRFMVNRHLANCPSCAATMEELLAMRTALRTRLPYHRAPPGLAARIGAALPREAASVTARRPWFRIPSIGFAGAGLAGAVAGVALTLLVTVPHGDSVIVRSAIDDHVRSMMAEHLTDVATSDRHTVRPWLSARIDVSPPVRDLSAEGFPLVGGRLDYVSGHPAAAVVYRRDKHVINLFAWSAEGQADAGFRSERHQGFNVVTWRRAGVAYAAVSDVELDQLRHFAALMNEPG